MPRSEGGRHKGGGGSSNKGGVTPPAGSVHFTLIVKHTVKLLSIRQQQVFIKVYTSLLVSLTDVTKV